MCLESECKLNSVYKTLVAYHEYDRFKFVSLQHKSRKGVFELRGPALGCMSVIDKNSAYNFVNRTILI